MEIKIIDALRANTNLNTQALLLFPSPKKILQMSKTFQKFCEQRHYESSFIGLGERCTARQCLDVTGRNEALQNQSSGSPYVRMCSLCHRLRGPPIAREWIWRAAEGGSRPPKRQFLCSVLYLELEIPS